MSDIKFTCVHCNQSLEAPPDMSGETIECPNCNGAIKVPSVVHTPRLQPSRNVVTTRSKPSAITGKQLHSHPGSPLTAQRYPRNKGIFILVGAILALILLAAYIASPFWTLNGMKNAVANNDAISIADSVDFPALRESLKANIQAQMASETAKPDADGFEAFGSALAAMMIGPMIDALVTPEGLIQIMQGKDIDSLSDMESGQAANSDSSTTGPTKMNISKMGYETINRFTVDISEDAHENIDSKNATLVFSRRGLLSWKLSGIRLKE